MSLPSPERIKITWLCTSHFNVLHREPWGGRPGGLSCSCTWTWWELWDAQPCPSWSHRVSRRLCVMAVSKCWTHPAVGGLAVHPPVLGGAFVGDVSSRQCWILRCFLCYRADNRKTQTCPKCWMEITLPSHLQANTVICLKGAVHKNRSDQIQTQSWKASGSEHNLNKSINLPTHPSIYTYMCILLYTSESSTLLAMTLPVFLLVPVFPIL